MFWIIMMSFVVLVALALMIYMLPSDPAVKVKKKKDKKAISDIDVERLLKESDQFRKESNQAEEVLGSVSSGTVILDCVPEDRPCPIICLIQTH